MKQEAVSYLNSIKDELINLNSYLYTNPEESFKEYKAYNYLTTLLKKYNFEITKNYLGIPTAFYAKYGVSYPSICLFCEYDADPVNGHISGHNLLSTISAGAGLALAKIMHKIGGSIVILGCPGVYLNGCKKIMIEQGTFKDIDVVLYVLPYVKNSNNLLSASVLPINIEYKTNNHILSTFDLYNLISNYINILKNTLYNDCDIKSLTIKGTSNPYYNSSKFESNYIITSPNIDQCNKISELLKTFINFISNSFKINCAMKIFELPYEEMIYNRNLSRIFSNNLKEAGLIDIKDNDEIFPELSIGCISHVVPCISPSISITQDNSIQFLSKEFKKSSITNFAFENAFKAMKAIILTGIDLIESDNLLYEIKEEFTKSFHM